MSGSCAGWPKPSWQSVYGNPSDKVRDLPDVSLFASNGFLFHYYIVCDSYDQTCFGSPATWPGAGGTSFASPIMAGMQALINQKAGSYQGDPNPVYYALADAEYGAAGNSSCDSSKGNAIASTCVFNDVTQGDMDVPCQVNSIYNTLIDCYDPSGTYGVLSSTSKSYEPAFPATGGWDFRNRSGQREPQQSGKRVREVCSSHDPETMNVVGPGIPALTRFHKTNISGELCVKLYRFWQS